MSKQHTIRVYVAHSHCFDYQADLYMPLEAMKLKDIEFFLPHKLTEQAEHSRKAILQADIVLAEVSHPSTGMGIELGWANVENKPIVAIYRSGSSVSSSLKLVCQQLVPYEILSDLNLVDLLL